MKNHALRIENLELSSSRADSIVAVLREFLMSLGYSEDRISKLECRSRPGFSPYSHNKGGLGAIAFTSMFYLPNGKTCFENTDKTLEKAKEYLIELCEDELGVKQDDWTDEHYERLSDMEVNDEDTILYSVDLMLNSESELNVRICICAKDSPYHRYYDDKFEFDIQFKSVKELQKKLNRLLKDKKVKQLISNIRDAY